MDSTGIYLRQIGQQPLLTAGEERKLAQAIESGRQAEESLKSVSGDRVVVPLEDVVQLRRTVREGKKAKDRFIEANLRLVVSIARKFPVPPSMELLDLIQEGNLGLEHAVDKFDWRKGFKFSTYATFWIRQAIGRAIDQKAALVKLPLDRAAGIRAALRRVENDPEHEELDEESSSLLLIASPDSLDRVLGHNDDTAAIELMDSISADEPTPEQVSLEAMDDSISMLLDGLDLRSRLAIELRFGLYGGEPLGFREVGEALGITTEAARRFVGRVLDSIKDGLGLEEDGDED